MTLKEEIREHYLHGHEKYLGHVSVDCVIFGFHNAELKVLLLKAGYANNWALPGGSRNAKRGFEGWLRRP